MIPKKIKEHTDKISEEAIHILKISGMGKDYEDTYERAKGTLGMLDIAVRMLIIELENVKARQTKKA